MWAGSDSRQGQTAAALVGRVEVVDVHKPSETHLLALRLDQATVACTAASGKEAELQMFLNLKVHCVTFKGDL